MGAGYSLRGGLLTTPPVAGASAFPLRPPQPTATSRTAPGVPTDLAQPRSADDSPSRLRSAEVHRPAEARRPPAAVPDDVHEHGGVTAVAAKQRQLRHVVRRAHVAKEVSHH